MSITIKEALNLPALQSFQLLAGEWGLNNTINTVCILDYEVLGNIEDSFGKNEFVLTSFTAARDNEDLLEHSIKALIQSGVCGLAIKNIFYKELPVEIIQYANKKNFPIFIFNNDVFFESIIEQVLVSIHERENDDLLEYKVDVMIKEGVSHNIIKQMAFEINNNFQSTFMVAFCKEINHINTQNNIKKITAYKKNQHLEDHISMFKYKDGILIILTHKNLCQDKLQGEMIALLETLDVINDDYINGISHYHTNLVQLSKAINEAIYTVKTQVISKYAAVNPIFYKDIGINKILLPFLHNEWIEEFSREIVDPLLEYDEKYHSQFFETALTYIRNDGDIRKTAKVLYQHENTIRYRIKKIKSILGMENSNGAFYEQLSIAIKVYYLSK